MAGRQVGVEGVNIPVAEAWRPAFDFIGINKQRRLFRMPQDAAAVRRVVEPRLRLVRNSGTRAPVIGRDAGDLRDDLTLGADPLGVHEA
jgi:hypothetical protein